jgi:hypothetical protein
MLKSQQTIFYLPPSFIKAYSNSQLEMKSSDGDLTMDAEAQRLLYHHSSMTDGHQHSVSIRVIGHGDSWRRIPVVFSILTLLIAVWLAWMVR